MTQKIAYIWGPVSSFVGPLVAWLVTRGWHVHLEVKSALNLFSLSPLDLSSSALRLIEEALGGHKQYRTFDQRIRLIESVEAVKGVKYDALIFAGLPPNFDEDKTARAPWVSKEIKILAKQLKGVPIFLVSSLWGAVQKDGVVPEEFEFLRRKPNHHWEGVCQRYEHRLLEALGECEATWYLVRVPMISGSTVDGQMLNFTGPYSLFHRVAQPASVSSPNGVGKGDTNQGKNRNTGRKAEPVDSDKILRLDYNENSTMWFLPIDTVVYMFWRFLEDQARPRILNLVSTQTMLNREWLTYLAWASGYDSIQQSTTDSLNLSGILRRLLKDDIQVKTRNLFEVAGRYRLQPVKLEQDYFEKVIRTAQAQNWGMPKEKPQQTVFSEKLARYYFEEFLPASLTGKLLKEAIARSSTIAFVIKETDKESNKLGWVLKTSNGKAVVEPLGSESERPQVGFHCSGATMSQLIQSKLSLNRALLLGKVEINGSLFKALRVVNVIERFWKEHPLNADQMEPLL